MNPEIPAHELETLEARMQSVFASGRQGDLDVLGFGEITTVVRWSAGGADFACKRLPDFHDEKSLEDYRRCFFDYLDRLRETGVEVAPTNLQTLRRGEKARVAYCVQPALSEDSLAVRILAHSKARQAEYLVDGILDRIMACVSSRVGLDGQLSNWAVREGELLYLDVTTPMLRDESGADMLNTDIFLASAPHGTRVLLKRFLLPGILNKYHSARGVVLDLVANLYKEGMEDRIPHLVELANKKVSPPLELKEVESYYQSDARVWILWQSLRKADRFWRMKVRGKPYPFLLPGRIERRV